MLLAPAPQADAAGPGARRLPEGFRWIAVRPGPPPPPPRRRPPLGPTPRYAAVPRWSLADPRPAPAQTGDLEGARSASVTVVRATLIAAGAVFAVAASVHLMRYLLLLVNRSTLLSPLLANGVLLLGVLAALAALAAVIATAAVATSWLVARRAEAYRRVGGSDPRPAWALWAGCLIPVVNLVWAPVFVIELAHLEGTRERLRGRIIAWWLAWVAATAVCLWTFRTGSATEPQAVADNTVAVIIAYLAGLAVLVLLWRLLNGFERPVASGESRRWVVVDERAADDGDRDGVQPRPDIAEDIAEEVVAEDAVESRDTEPAA